MGVFDEGGQEWTIERMLSQKITPENILEATKKIRPILSGLGPTHQAGVPADLVAIWLAGHAPVARADVFETLLLMIRELVPDYAWRRPPVHRQTEAHPWSPSGLR